MYSKRCPEYLPAAISDKITRAINIVFTCVIYIKPYIVLEIFTKVWYNYSKSKELMALS